MNLAFGFHQILIDLDSQGKTALSTPHGHLQFKSMPVGLKNAPATFQRIVNQVPDGPLGHRIVRIH